MLVIISFWIVFQIAGLVTIGHLLLSRKPTPSLILWTVWLAILPVIGIPLYLVIGTDRIRRDMLPGESFPFAEAISDPGIDASEASSLLVDAAHLPGNFLTRLSKATPLPDSDHFYPHLLQRIDRARKFVHVQTYVFRSDATAERFLQALVRAARRGVTVRLLVDEIGSGHTSRDYFKPLTDAGGFFSWCQTINPRRNRYFVNLRNHRKIQIVDGEIAYVGGMNFGREYAGGNPDVGPWRDMQMAVEGPVVGALQTVFASDWKFATEEHLEPADHPAPESAPPSIPVTVVNSGPDNPHRSFLKTFLLACHYARDRLDIFTPYFGPEDPVIVGMQLAARRGVRVRMLIPTPNEHKYMVDIGRAHYRELMEDGVEIYEYHEAVHHGKVYLIDNDHYVLGSTNLDARSFRLNFETTLLVRDQNVVRQLDEHYASFFEAADRITDDIVERWPLREKLKQGASRLFAPVL